jgi:hypothetical protein
MKNRLLALFCALPLAASLSPVAFAQNESTSSKQLLQTWRGAARLETLHLKQKTREISAVYPVFLDSRRVARVAESVIKRDASRDFRAFEKGSRGSAKDLGLMSGMSYASEFTPALVLNAPRLVSVAVMGYEFQGGAHGMYGTSGYVFGFPRGSNAPRQLRLADFFTDGSAAKARVNRLLMNHLRATKGREQSADFVIDGTVKSLDPAQLENFVVLPNGSLKWFFAPYSVASYAAGEFEVSLSSRELGPTFRAIRMR